jgi:hypothetical protein
MPQNSFFRTLIYAKDELLAGIFFNSLTLAWAEVCGRSYGGGVLELEPREAEELPIPYSADIKIDRVKVESLLRCFCQTKRAAFFNRK